MKRKLLLLALLVAVTAGAAALLLRLSAQPQKALSTTGIYAEDWLANCGALQGTDQAKCTERLNDAYGRLAGTPVPRKP